MNEQVQQVMPLQFAIDIQPGPDGNPWIRWQFGQPAIAATIVFPIENAETVIDAVTMGTRKAVKEAMQKNDKVIVPDFTGIKVKPAGNSHKSNRQTPGTSKTS